MFGKLLIANRGEVARRIIKTCKLLSIKTVAIYSESDADSLAVIEADEAYCVGPAPSVQSYLNIPAIIAICQQASVDAVHPGFGFLAENAEFAQAVMAAGMTFIGPSPDIIRLMGDKLTAKEAAARSGLPLVPGIAHAIDSVAEAADFAAKHGYPILLKAAAGGGGKGMRVVHEASELSEALVRCQSEARSSFNDSRVFVEKYIINPRHIEVQILGDAFGHVVHLGERDCSIQRRHQKIIEESPSPSISQSLREKMTRAAVALAKDVGYQSAGTVEFVVTPSEEFYFLEMNTRLQVEHPVTEECFGIDLVEWMIRIAAGQPLAFAQDQLISKGHAIELRLYAEDADGDFLPSAGKLIQFIPPQHKRYRLDSGVIEGDDVSIFYDPMLAKLICHEDSRETALESLNDCLSQFIIQGPEHNLNFLSRVINHPHFVSGNVTTHFIEKHYHDLRSYTQETSKLSTFEADILVALACVIGLELQPTLVGHRLAVVDQLTNHAIQAESISLQDIVVDNKQYEVHLTWHQYHQAFKATINGAPIAGLFKRGKTGFELTIKGRRYLFDVMNAETFNLLKHLPKRRQENEFNALKAPMPGVLISLPIQPGDMVRRGQALAIIEAMKMENTLKAPADAIVKEVSVKLGDSLQRNQIIAIFGDCP